MKPTKFSLVDFTKDEGIVFDVNECLQRYLSLPAEDLTFNMAFYHYLEFIKVNPSISLDQFKETVNNGGIFVGLSSLCIKAILENSIERHKCNTCSVPCRMKCSLCKEVMYCDQDCQRLDWENHKIKCEKLAKARNDRKRITSKLEDFIQKRIQVSPSITFRKFYRIQLREMYLKSCVD